jgi:hypothetical protein
MDVMCAGGVCVPDPAIRQRDGEATLSASILFGVALLKIFGNT